MNKKTSFIDDLISRNCLSITKKDRNSFKLLKILKELVQIIEMYQNELINFINENTEKTF